MNRRWTLTIGLGVLAVLIIAALALSTSGGLPGSAQPLDPDPTYEADPTYEGNENEEMCETTEGVIPCDEVCEDEYGDLIRCPDDNDNNENVQGGSGAEPTPRRCSIFVPDVGDADELGLIATDAGADIDILISSDSDGDPIVARISQPFQGNDVFQVPEAYRSADYWFAVEGCGRWHGGQELGFGD